ncbi:outer membrane protein with beta-barrel domain [Arcicella aurantiaca]|uniref:Outer membrane protein with beta-barrel domain n=1 Tax=Arcicella aurantiaca TaxID=591202 RepID=A0A316EIV0_9BACT|nr:porin family protein [Arcicella aurantiaca]PWK28779.1 outer membrane protein with beta-barrel domain [Arcicella aurantiaca]
MKKLMAAIALSVITFAKINAQSVAFKAGYTHSDVLVSPEPANIFTPKETFHAGIAIKDLKLNDKIGFQPEVLYSMQGFKVAGVGNVGIHYLSVPLLVTFPVADGLELQVGPQVSYMVNSRVGVVSDLFSVSYKGLFNDIDAGAVAGVEYKISDNVSLGGRYYLGMTNVNKDFSLGSNSNFSDYFQMKNTGLQAYVSFSFGKK